jgi:alpha-mannosidase
LGLVQPQLPRSEVPTIAVFNTLNWPRSGIVEVYIDHEILPPGKAFCLEDEEGKEAHTQVSRSRADGTYWSVQAQNIPPLGYKVYCLELLEKPHKPAKKIKTSETLFENDFYRMTIDPERGAVSSLFDKQLKMDLFDKQSPWLLGQFIHETISNRSQLEQFHLVSSQRQPLNRVSIQKVLDGFLWKSIHMTGETLTAAENTTLGIEIRLFHKEKRIEFHYDLIKKDVTAPEAIYIAFPFKMPQATIFYEAHGGTVSPGRNQLEGTSSDWNVFQNFISLRGPKGQIVFGSDEVPLVQFGDLNLGKFQYIAEVEKPHIFSWVMNNYWVTNFRASQEGEFKWSYFLTSGEDISNTSATRYGWSSRIPLLCRVFPPGKASDKPKDYSTILIDADNILLVSAKPCSDGKSIILHLRETEGKPTKFSVSIPSARSQNQVITEVNVLGEAIRQPSETLMIEAWESTFYKIIF